MLGLLYVVGALLFVMAVFWVAHWVWRSARQNRLSVAAAFICSGLSIIFALLIPFWNIPPSIIAFREMCAKDAGFERLVDPARWVALHEDRLKALAPSDFTRTTTTQQVDPVRTRYGFFGGLLVREYIEEETRRYGLEFRRSESLILDAETSSLLSRRVDYSVGSREDVRIWLTRRSCFSRAAEPIDSEQAFLLDLRGRKN